MLFFRQGVILIYCQWKRFDNPITFYHSPLEFSILLGNTCESSVLMQVECIRGNVLGVLNLADVTMQKGLHVTNFATGCIFHYDDKFTIESGKVSIPDGIPLMECPAPLPLITATHLLVDTTVLILDHL